MMVKLAGLPYVLTRELFCGHRQVLSSLGLSFLLRELNKTLSLSVSEDVTFAKSKCGRVYERAL